MTLMLGVVAFSIVVVGYFVANEIAYVGYQLEQLSEKFTVIKFRQEEEGEEDE